MLGVHGPDDFIQRGDHLPRPVANLFQMSVRLFVGAGRRPGHGDQHADFGDARAEFIVQVLGDARAFLLHRPLVLDALAFLDLDFEFGRAVLDLAVELGDPQAR